MQYAFLPLKSIYIGQGYGLLSSSHKNSYALDLSGTQDLFAPFDCEITGIYIAKKKNGSLDTSKAFEVWLSSTKKVLCANGVYDYITISITHPKDISKLKKGQKFKQFDSLGLSTKNMTGRCNGPHAHIEVSLGISPGWDQTIIKKKKDYVNINRVKPEEYLFRTEDSKIKKEKWKIFTYHFVTPGEITYKVQDVPSEPLYIRTQPYPKGSVIGNLYNGDYVLKFNNKAYIYYDKIFGYTSNKYLKK